MTNIGFMISSFIIYVILASVYKKNYFFVLLVSLISYLCLNHEVILGNNLEIKLLTLFFFLINSYFNYEKLKKNEFLSFSTLLYIYALILFSANLNYTIMFMIVVLGAVLSLLTRAEVLNQPEENRNNIINSILFIFCVLLTMLYMSTTLLVGHLYFLILVLVTGVVELTNKKLEKDNNLFISSLVLPCLFLFASHMTELRNNIEIKPLIYIPITILILKNVVLTTMTKSYVSVTSLIRNLANYAILLLSVLTEEVPIRLGLSLVLLNVVMFELLLAPSSKSLMNFKKALWFGLIFSFIGASFFILYFNQSIINKDLMVYIVLICLLLAFCCRVLRSLKYEKV